MKKRIRAEGATAVVESVRADERICRFIGAEAGDEGIACFIGLGYAARDPLVITVSLCAPSRAPVIERSVMRADLRDALQRRIYDADIVMTPDALRGRTLFRFREPGVAVTAMVPARAIAEFIRDSDRVVPFGSGEVDAINAALETLVSDERLSPGR